MKTNTETIAALYEAFGQGNIPFIVENVAETFTWTDPSDPAIVPYGGTHVGRDGFLYFFQQLGGQTQTTHWSVENYAADGDVVFATGQHGITVPKTGKNDLTHWAMRWQFAGGQVVAGESFYDTAGVAEAFR